MRGVLAFPLLFANHPLTSFCTSHNQSRGWENSPHVVTRPGDGDDYDDADDARAAVLGCMQMSSSPIVNRSLTRNSEYSYGRGCVSQNYRNYHRRE